MEWALDSDAYVIEDDYDSEFAFGGKPLPALQNLDRFGRVIYVGPFSKTLARTLAPGLRLGYLIVPPHLAEAFSVAAARRDARRHALRAGDVGGFRRRRALRAPRAAHDAQVCRTRRALIEVLEAGLPAQRFRIGVGNVGLHVAVAGSRISMMPR